MHEYMMMCVYVCIDRYLGRNARVYDVHMERGQEDEGHY